MTNSNNNKKSLAIFSLTCCEGCQFAILRHYEKFNSLLNFFEVENFRLAQEDNEPGPFDVAIVEGTPESKVEIDRLKMIRKQSDILIAMGSCAHLGGIQSERNSLPNKFIRKPDVKTVPNVVKVDYILPGCPVNHDEVFKCLIDIYWGKVFKLPDHSVCFECRQNENECLLKQGKACLGPVTRGGCNSVCVNGGEMCFGCRGAIDQANFEKMIEILEPIIEEREIKSLLSIFGEYQKEWKGRKNDK